MNKHISPLRPRTLTVGCSILGTEIAEYADFFTKKNFADYDFVLIDPAGALVSKATSYNDTVFFAHSSQGELFCERFREVVRRIDLYLGQGGFCVMLLRKLPDVHYYIDGDDQRISLTDLLPYGRLECHEAHGVNVEWAAEGPFAEFGKATAGCFSYSAFFEDNEQRYGVANVSGYPKQGLAARFSFEDGGTLVLLPTLPSPKDARQSFLAPALFQLRAKLSAKPVGSVSLPEWTKDFALPGEKAIVGDIADNVRRINNLEIAGENLRAQLRDLQRFKALVGGYGEVLEHAVRDALGELGLIVKPGPPKRADFIATWKGQTFVIEVQGVKKSAKEDHVRSLMMWAAETGIELKKDPKGLLVVNAFRDTPPPERTQNPWPPNVVGKTTQQQFCALSGLQLLGLLFEARVRPERRDDLVQLLLDTSGVLQGFDTWKDVLSY
jgi:hypothetical protein